ncbi:MAG: hypothetical protein IPN29_04855 [Saprospiraceae bacterium]|nr:hypothetical protein [Saprospiraceae bacterium]
MKHLTLLILTLVCHHAIWAQFTGTYAGTLNGDNIVMTLEQSDKRVTGQMKDSGQTYQIEATVANERLDGKAVDGTYGITFFLTGYLNAEGMEMDFDLDLGGYRQDAFIVMFQHSGATTSQGAGTSQTGNKPDFLNKKQIDSALIGTWKNESFYSSGYGADAMSGGTVSYLSFNADGTMSDQGGGSSISGSYYSGNSGNDGGSGAVPNVWYYTEGKMIYVFTNAGGQEQTVELGTYYIENGNLLITNAGGNKLLLQKIR